MQRVTTLLLFLLYTALVAVLGYEFTSKSPDALGLRLPGWQAGIRAERTTAWRSHTGFEPLDHLIHETEEAARFYTYLLDDRRDQDRLRIAARAGLGG